jgi:uncharacterized protein (DUF1501 family)
MSAATMLTALSYAGLENAFAQGTDYKAMVCIFLEGGNDGWNTVIPLDSAGYATYASNRGALALAQSSLLPINPAGAGSFGLHPSMPGIQSLFSQGKVAIVCNVGNLFEPVTSSQVLANPAVAPSGLFDHFQQQTWAQNLRNDNTQGWGNSLGKQIQGFNSGPLIPMLMGMVNDSPFLKGGASTITLQPGLQLGITGLPATGTPPVRFSALQSLTTLVDNSVQVNSFNARVERAIEDSKVVGNIFSGTQQNKET